MNIPISIPKNNTWLTLNSRSVKLAVFLSISIHISIIIKLLTGALFLAPTSAEPTGEYVFDNTILILGEDDFSDIGDYKAIAKPFLKKSLEKDYSSKGAQDLEELKKKAKNISGDSLSAIAVALGGKKGEYVPRTVYHNEFNPNANLAASTITDAKYEDGAHTLYFQDKQKDTFSVDLLNNESLVATIYDGKPLAGSAEGFELKGAKVTFIKRIRIVKPKIKTFCEVTLKSISGKKLVVTIYGKKARPFLNNCARYMMKADGTPFYPDDGMTFGVGKFDHNSTQVYDVKDITKKGGVTTFVVTYIDRKGERLIAKLEGQQAEHLRPFLKATSDPTLIDIYQKSMIPILNQLMKK